METPNLQELIAKTEAALVDADATKYYQHVFKQVYRQLLVHARSIETDTFSMDFGLQFLEDHYSMTERIKDHKWPVIYSRCINEISDYQRTGYVACYKGRVLRTYVIPASFKPSTDAYFAYRKKIGITDKSIQISTLHLERFFSFLKKNQATEPNQISIKLIYKFLEYLSVFEKSTVNHTMRTVRYYLKYCHENGFSNQELFSKLPNVHYNRQSRLPSSYSSEEVNTLLESIDQGNPGGKRDYAIILLISRLGLRSSDVANLRFSNIDWENDVIHLFQKKTGTPLKLPLLEDVGEAIINYLKNARPKTESDHVFVMQKPPFTEFKSSCVGSLVHNHLRRSGIRIEGRKQGSHTLRHSLASRLLEHEISLPVISEILGHTNTETTMTYLRIDVPNLKKCALEVIL